MGENRQHLGSAILRAQVVVEKPCLSGGCAAKLRPVFRAKDCKMRTFLMATSTAILPMMAQANDGFGGITATGLTFSQTEDVAMLTEDLYISQDKITVDYTFKNTATTDVTGEVIFPMPPISLWEINNGTQNLPEDFTRDNLVNFTALVDGKPVEVKIDRVAIKFADNAEWPSSSAQYDTPGSDVTEMLAKMGIPISLDNETVVAKLLGLTKAQQDELAAAKLAEFYTADGSPDGVATEAVAQWAIVLRYHWTQTFPAGKELAVSHAYENYPAGAIFGWSPGSEADEYSSETAKTYCIDTGTSKAISKAIKLEEQGEINYVGSASYPDYVLRTANSWAGPIGKFKLTVDKGRPENVVSFCADGVTKTGPTTFVVEKTNYVPEQDLQILIVTGMN
jgi:hypothetical protein